MIRALLRLLPALLLSLSVSWAREPVPLALGIEVEWDRARSGRDRWREDMHLAIVEEMEDALCFEAVSPSREGADLVLSVRLREFSVEEGEGGAPQINDRTGELRMGRSYLVRIDLVFALLPPESGEPLHVGDFRVAARQGTTSNPLFDPEQYALREARGQAARELRRKVCRRSRRLAEALAERQAADSSPR